MTFKTDVLVYASTSFLTKFSGVKNNIATDCQIDTYLV
jgi:hypothetical protein